MQQAALEELTKKASLGQHALRSITGDPKIHLLPCRPRALQSVSKTQLSVQTLGILPGSTAVL